MRHWQATGAESSRQTAYQLLRGLTYLQTAEGPNAGNVVLWMQPDGTLNPSADPVEFPDPSDSGESYWLARTIWALGEAYPAFRNSDRAFAAFLRDRFELALGAVERQVLDRYGEWLDIDGVDVPAWLIVDGADATGEALLGLAPYVAATGDPRAQLALRQLGEGVAAMRSGDPRTWPFGAVLPWSLSQAVWHAWGGLAPAGLAQAYGVTGDRPLRRAALSDAATFTPHLLIAAGPENGWLPSPTERVQIAYGAHSRVESLLAAAEAGNRPGLRHVAGIAAAWFFGNNPAGEAMYDPATGRTYDGVAADGSVNRNSGAESTIHGLLTTLILDRHADIAALARVAHVDERRTWTLVEAETGELGSRAALYQPAGAWTGESLWSGGAGVRISPGGTLTISVGDIGDGANLLMPVVLLDPSAGTTTWTTPRRVAGVIRHARVGAQGDSPAPGLLAIETLPSVGARHRIRGRPRDQGRRDRRRPAGAARSRTRRAQQPLERHRAAPELRSPHRKGRHQPPGGEDGAGGDLRRHRAPRTADASAGRPRGRQGPRGWVRRGAQLEGPPTRSRLPPPDPGA